MTSEYDKLDSLEEELTELEESVDALSGIPEVNNKRFHQNAKKQIEKLETQIKKERKHLFGK